MPVQPSDTEVIQHWEKIISVVRGSQLAKVWFEFKLGPRETDNKILVRIKEIGDHRAGTSEILQSPKSTPSQTGAE